MFCSGCGKEIPEGSKFCPECGKATNGTPNVTNTVSDSDSTKTLMAILAYILFFIPLLTGAHKTSDFVKYHTNQGTVLFLATLIFSIALSIITAIFTTILIAIGAWGLLKTIGTILGLLWLAPLALCILGIVNVVKNQTKPLPVIGKFTIIK